MVGDDGEEGDVEDGGGDSRKDGVLEKESALQGDWVT